MEAKDQRARGDGERRRGQRRGEAVIGLLALVPAAGGDRAEGVLARDRHVQRAAEGDELTEAAKDLNRMVDAQVEIETRVEHQLSAINTAALGLADLGLEPLSEVSDDIAVLGNRPIHTRRTLDVGQHETGAGLGSEVEHRRVDRAPDVVDHVGAGLESSAGNLGTKRVGAERQFGALGEAGDRGTEPLRLLVGGHRLAGPSRHCADVEHAEALTFESQAVGHRLFGGATARARVHRVVGDVDDADAERCVELERLPTDLPDSHRANLLRGRVASRSVALKAVYTDLDGTMLGPMGNLFAAPDGSFSKAQTLALEACHRAGVEVVIMSGRREAQVLSDSRLMGQTSYIYEAGCGVVIDREKTLLTGDWSFDDHGGGPAEQMIAAGIADRLFEHFGARLEWHAPWHEGRELSLLFRGLVDVEEANTVLREAGHDDLRFLDNGAIRTTVTGIEIAHAYHLVPRGSSKSDGVAFHMQARGYSLEEVIGIGDSIEDIECSHVVGRFYVVANGPKRDPGVRAAIAGRPNVRVTDGEMGDGFYEAVIESLATG